MPKQIDKTLATAEISRVNAAATLPKKKRQAKAPRIPPCRHDRHSGACCQSRYYNCGASR